MSNWFMFIVLTVFQCLAGLGLVSLFRISLKPALMIALWMLTGVAVFSFIPFLLQLVYIPLTATTIFLALLITCLLLNIRYKQSLDAVKKTYAQRSFRVKMYEAPFLLIIVALVLISVWRCYYWPPTPRDLTSGAEVIADYATREKTMINSVFTVNMQRNNNQFKPPFITCLQIIYKYAGFPFGQVWLSTIFISFLVFLYHAMAQKIHRLLAGLLLVAFIAIPEMYAYTFMVLFDYSNAVFFFLSAWFLIEYFKNGERNYLLFASLLMAMATYIRSETLILAGFLTPGFLLYTIRNRQRFSKLLISTVLFLVPAAIIYLLTINIYIDYYLPTNYDIVGQVNPDLWNIHSLVKRLMTINKNVLFSEQGIIYYAYFVFIFLFILIIDLVLLRKQNVASRNFLFSVLVVYFGLTILGHVLPGLDIDHSTKRGFMKLFPLMLLYMGNSPGLIKLSEKINSWETNP